MNRWWSDWKKRLGIKRDVERVSNEAREQAAIDEAATVPSRYLDRTTAGLNNSERYAANEEYPRAVADYHAALENWRVAQHRLEWAVGMDEIDYAIYSLIAAEKQYAAKLKETKRLHRAVMDDR